jgi:hypothetical protein
MAGRAARLISTRRRAALWRCSKLGRSIVQALSVIEDHRTDRTATPSAGRLQQIGGLHTQCDGQRLDVVECDVDEPGFDLADMRLVEISELGQSLLTQPLCLAKAPDVRPENAARRLWVRPVHLDGRTKVGLETL